METDLFGLSVSQNHGSGQDIIAVITHIVRKLLDPSVTTEEPVRGHDTILVISIPVGIVIRCQQFAPVDPDS